MIWTIGMYFVIGAIVFVTYLVGVIIWGYIVSDYDWEEFNDMFEWMEDHCPSVKQASTFKSEKRLCMYLTAWVIWPVSILNAVDLIAKSYKEYKKIYP